MKEETQDLASTSPAMTPDVTCGVGIPVPPFQLRKLANLGQSGSQMPVGATIPDQSPLYAHCTSFGRLSSSVPPSLGFTREGHEHCDHRERRCHVRATCLGQHTTIKQNDRRCMVSGPAEHEISLLQCQKQYQSASHPSLFYESNKAFLRDDRTNQTKNSMCNLSMCHVATDSLEPKLWLKLESSFAMVAYGCCEMAIQS